MTRLKFCILAILVWGYLSLLSYLGATEPSDYGLDACTQVVFETGPIDLSECLELVEKESVGSDTTHHGELEG